MVGKKSSWSGVVVIATLLGATTPAHGQHGTGTATAADGACATCHASHTPDAGSYALRLDGSGSARATGLSEASQSCLRCHATPQDRARQADVLNLPLAVTEGSYLGLDMSDDHAMGFADASRRSEDAQGLAMLRPGYRSSNTWSGRSAMRAGSLECTTCHDPHQPAELLSTRGELEALCGSCHDPSSYLLSGHSASKCSDCHRLHGGSDPHLLVETNTDLVCRSCHGGGGLQRKGDALVGVARTPEQAHAGPRIGLCVECHSVHNEVTEGGPR